MSKQKSFRIALLTLFFVFGGFFAIFSIWKLLLSPTLQDFTTYYIASQDFLHHQNPYANLHNTYIYPPGSLFLIAPIALVGYSQAVIIWSMLSLILLVISFLTITWTLFQRYRWLFFFLLFLFSWSFFPLKFSFGMGQINVILFCLCISSFFFWKYQKETIGGVLLGAAITLKLFPLFFLFFFIRKRSWRFLLSTLVTFCLLNGIVFLWFGEKFGYQILIDYFTHIITQAVGGFQNDAYYNQSLIGFLAKIHMPTVFTSFVQIASILFLFGISFFITKPLRNTLSTDQGAESEKELAELSLFFLSWLITSRVSWQHYFVFSLLPMAILFCHLLKREGSFYLKAGLLTSYILIGWNFKNGTEQFHGTVALAFLYSHVLWGTILLYFLILRILLKKAPHALRDVSNL